MTELRTVMHYKYKMNVWNSGKDKEKKVRQPLEKKEHFPKGKNRAIAKNIQEKWPSNFTTGEKKSLRNVKERREQTRVR